MHNKTGYKMSRYTVRGAIDIIRNTTLSNLADYPDGNPWDEEQHGANWIESDFGFFLEIWFALDGIRNAGINPQCNSVAAWELFLDMFSRQIIISFYHFEHVGGTSNSTFWEFINAVRGNRLISPVLRHNILDILGR
jgi:hypothetical protein